MVEVTAFPKDQNRMQVLGANKHGEYNDSLEYMNNLPIPTSPPSENDLLIEIAYSDVNPVDLQKLRGNKGPGHPVVNPPFVPGFGGSGTVLSVGQQAPSEWKGENVCFLADPSRRGSYATHILVDYRCVALIPSGVSLRDAGTIPVAGLTAFESLSKVGLAMDDAKSNEKSLLIVGGAGGVGSWTMVLARAWHPSLKIIATASTKEQQEWCQTLGANEVIEHDEIDRRLQGGREGSVDAIICLAEPTTKLFGSCAEVIRPYGKICLVVAGEGIQSLDMSFCFFKCATIATETVFSSIRTKFEHILPAKELQSIMALMSEGKIQAPVSPDIVSGKVSLDGLHNAISSDGKFVLHALAQPGGRRGKLVMKIY